MADAVSVIRNGHRTFLKWHRARRRASDPAFTGRRILQGMALGASVEVDLVVHADDGFAVLHDLTLDRATTGTGPVGAAGADRLRSLRLRDGDGNPLPDRVMLLEDLVSLIASAGIHPEALLQLDYKQDAAALTARAIATFGHALGAEAPHFILSSGDAESVRLMKASTRGLRIGYDPCHDGAIERLAASRAHSAFVGEALAAAPQAEVIYLHHRVVLLAHDDGFDMVEAFHRAGRRVDAYTIRQADDEGVRLAARLLDLRVDQVTTDDPEGLAAALG